MKKISPVLLSVIFIILIGSINVFAAEEVIEMNSLKIIMNGESKTFTDVPIVVNNRTLLPLRQILVYLGVPNDDQHIIWNQSTQSVTVRNNGIEIYLKLYDNRAKVNGEEIILDVASTAYKQRTYIPVRFVSQALKKTVLWDGSFNAVYITDEEKYNQTEAVLDEVAASLDKVEDVTYKISYNVDVQGKKTAGTESIKTDFINKTTYYKSETAREDGFLEGYFLPKEAYVRIKEEGPGWIKWDLTEDTNALDAMGLMSDIIFGDAQYTGLIVDTSASTQSETVLKGEVLTKNALNKILHADGTIGIGAADGGWYKSSKVTLYIDNASKKPKKVEAAIEYTAIGDEGKAEIPVSGKITYEYQEFNGKINLKVPYIIQVEAKEEDMESED